VFNEAESDMSPVLKRLLGQAEEDYDYGCGENITLTRTETKQVIAELDMFVKLANVRMDTIESLEREIYRNSIERDTYNG